VSDMLQPLPELDLNFMSFGSAREAVGAVPSAASPVDDGQPEALSRLSYAAVIRGEEGDAASRVISSDDSWSSGNESSPGGFRKRHSVSPFRLRVDKKSLQIPKGCGRGIRRGPFTDNTVRQPPLPAYGRGIGHGPSDTAVSQSVFLGRGRGLRHGTSSDSVVGHPVFHGRGCGIRHGASSDTSLDQSFAQAELQSRVDAGAWTDDLWVDAGRQHELRQMTSGPFHSSRDPVDAGFHLTSAACEDSFAPAECQYTPAYFTPREQSSNVQATHKHLLSDIGQSASVSSAASAGAADINSDSPLQCRRSKVIRHGCRLFSVLEQSGDNDVESRASAHGDAEVELMKFEPPAR